MPRQRCTVCQRDDVQAIDAAYRAGEPVRAIAKRFGITAASADRHFHHKQYAEARKNIGDLAHIDEEIKKLKRAQNKAKKNRDNRLALQIARELRNWFTMRQKAALATIGTQSVELDAQLSPAEALALAKAVIEAQLTDPSMKAWIASLYERVGQSEPAEES